MPNEKLASWLARTGMSRGELARRVKAKATAWNEPHIATSTTRVRFWLEGQMPRQPLPDIIAAVFSDCAGFRVTTYDLGFGESNSAEHGLVYNASFADAVETVSDLGRADVDRRTFIAGVPFAVLAGVGPSRDWLVNVLDQTVETGPRVRLEDVTAVRNMFAEFQRMDVLQGGGSGRLVLAEYMTMHVYPLLRRAYSAQVRQALCEAAAEQTYLLGWMAYDNGEHGVAQRYLIQSLRLAEESGNTALGSHILAGMADQATLLGDPDEGRRLAQAGRVALSRVEAPACLADLWCLEGRALALLGDAKGAAHAVVESEKAYTRVRPEAEPEWATFIDPAYLHGEHANTFRDLGDPTAAAEHARKSIEHAKSQNRARRGAMSYAALAASHVQRNDLEAAHAAGIRTLNLTKQVKSSRAVEAVHDIQRRMRTLGAHRLVADFNERVRDLVATE
ncbi:transcriptional regulator [Antribacter gilvus]|uniref:transcriptional regulator n=1 Tax=Antribacter gilvus TaxID=2304675 RepID=UPI000F788B8C|nr:transcriptional regulator [Antribacter gilvus]